MTTPHMKQKVLFLSTYTSTNTIEFIELGMFEYFGYTDFDGFGED